MNAKEIIAKYGGEVVDGYSLISNWGYIVAYNGAEYDVRRWANCYGSDRGCGVMWIKSRGGQKDEEWVARLDKALNNYELNTER